MNIYVYYMQPRCVCVCVGGGGGVHSDSACSMRAMSRVLYMSYSDWLHHNNLIYIVILNYIGLYCPVNNKIGLDNNPMGVCCIALYS